MMEHNFPSFERRMNSLHVVTMEGFEREIEKQNRENVTHQRSKSLILKNT